MFGINTDQQGADVERVQAQVQLAVQLGERIAANPAEATSAE